MVECDAAFQVDGQKTFTYPIQIDLTIHTDNGVDLHAIMSHAARCYEMPDHPNRLGVTFSGGSLTPASSVRSDPTLMAIWEEVFDRAYAKAEEERTFMSSIMQYVFKSVFQLTTPTDEDAAKDCAHTVSFDMKRSPRGYLDVLYLDQDIRITKGNRGTIIVVERLSNTQKVFQALN